MPGQPGGQDKDGGLIDAGTENLVRSLSHQYLEHYTPELPATWPWHKKGYGHTKIFLIESIQSSLGLGHQRLSSCKVLLTAGLKLSDVFGNNTTLLSLYLRGLILQVHLGLLHTHLQIVAVRQYLLYLGCHVQLGYGMHKLFCIKLL